MNGPVARLRHDLRTPVNHILGYTELLMEDCDAPGSAAVLDRLRQIRSAGGEMLAAIDRALPPDGAPRLHLGNLAARLRECACRLHADLAALRSVGGCLAAGVDADLDRIAAAAAALVLRCDQSAALAAPTPSSTGVGSPGGHAPGRVPASCLLVVDDDAQNRELLGRRLARDGHRVLYAADGADALAVLERSSVDLVLLDVMMPRMDGEEALRRLKAEPRHADIPVLMISAVNEHAAVVRCIAAGADDYLPKPADPVLLRARLGACLARKRARDLELEYLRQVGLLTSAAEAVKAGTYDAASLEPVSRRDDALGELARAFRDMTHEVHARERRLSKQVVQLRIEVDEAKKARAVSAIVETEHFAALQRRAAELRRAALPG